MSNSDLSENALFKRINTIYFNSIKNYYIDVSIFDDF